MSKLTDWIKSHQVTAFFVITFAISWGLGFTYDAVMNKGTFLLAPLVFAATCGPALAGIIVSAVCNTRPEQGQVYHDPALESQGAGVLPRPFNVHRQEYG